MDSNIKIGLEKLCVDAEWIHLVKASNKLWATVNRELNFGMNGRCGVHGQLSNHYNVAILLQSITQHVLNQQN